MGRCSRWFPSTSQSPSEVSPGLSERPAVWAASFLRLSLGLSKNVPVASYLASLCSPCFACCVWPCLSQGERKLLSWPRFPKDDNQPTHFSSNERHGARDNVGPDRRRSVDRGHFCRQPWAP